MSPENQHSVDQARRDGRLLLLLGGVVLSLVGIAFHILSAQSMYDFRFPFYGTRCVLQGHDPYNSPELMAVYRQDLSVYSRDPEMQSGKTEDSRLHAVRFVYLPTILLVLLPLAPLPFELAGLIWTILTIAGLIGASYLVWQSCEKWAPLLAGALLAFLLVNSELVVIVGNPAGVAIGLSMFGVWCFLRERNPILGVVSLGISLAMKPHDIFVVWLYFILAGGKKRKWAAQALLVSVAIGVCSTLLVSHVAPHWYTELHATLTKASMRGEPDDPGPRSSEAHTPVMMINLQTALSFIHDEPPFYNLMSWGICGLLTAFWIAATVRRAPSLQRAWLALAAAVPLTILPIYHRIYDAKLLILALPACALLWSEGGKIGRWALFFTATAFVCTADLPWMIYFTSIHNFNLTQSTGAHTIAAAVQVFLPTLSLLALGVFYLWVYVRRSPEPFAIDG